MVTRLLVHLTRLPGKSRNYHQLKGNLRHLRGSLGVRGKFQLDLEISMGKNGTPSI